VATAVWVAVTATSGEIWGDMGRYGEIWGDMAGTATSAARRAASPSNGGLAGRLPSSPSAVAAGGVAAVCFAPSATVPPSACLGAARLAAAAAAAIAAFRAPSRVTCCEL